MGAIGKIIVGLMPIAPKFLVKRIAGRYVAGSNLESAIDLMKELVSSTEDTIFETCCSIFSTLAVTCLIF